MKGTVLDRLYVLQGTSLPARKTSPLTMTDFGRMGEDRMNKLSKHGILWEEAKESLIL